MYGRRFVQKERLKMRRMKMIVFVICILCILLFVAATFTSCKEKGPETADELIERVEAAMDAAGSYKQKFEMKLEVLVSGTKMSLDADGTGITINTEDDYYSYNEMNMEMTVGDSKASEKSTSIEVYDGGRVYFLEDADKNVTKYASDATAEEYRAYLDAGGNIDDYIYDCETKEFFQNEDGTWELVLGDYTDKALDGMYEKAGLALLFSADSIKDIKTEILVDEDFCVLEYELKFRFNKDEEGNKPQAVFKSEFSKHGEAEREEIDTDDYKNMKNLLGMKTLDRALDRLITRENAKANLKLEQTITDKYGNEAYNHYETDTITYGIRDGKFFFDMDAIINGEKLRIAYENGKQTTTAASTSETTDMDELVAKATIAKILDCTGYNIETVKSFVDKGDGVYEVKLDKKNAEEYKNAFGSNTQLHAAVLNAIYTVKNGEIVSIEAKGDVEGVSGYTGYSLDISISLTLE